MSNLVRCPSVCQVTLDANSGVFPDTVGGGSTHNLIKSYGLPIGSLPIPTRNKYKLKGWFTELTGGVEVTSDTKLCSLGGTTLYTQWELYMPDILYIYNKKQIQTIRYFILVAIIHSQPFHKIAQKMRELKYT